MSLANHSVLLIEDDSNDIVLLERVCDRVGLSKPMHIVRSGEHAILYLNGQDQYADRVRHPIPTFIFLDLRLPGLSGFEVLTWIRQQSRFLKIPVVVLTGSRKSLDVYRAYELGANSYLVKPVKPEDLLGMAQSLKLPWLTLAETPQVHPVPVPSSALGTTQTFD